MQKSARSNGWLKWLLILNLIGLTLLGGRYWYRVQQDHREDRKLKEAAVNIETRVTGAPREDLVRLFDLSDQFLRKEGVSDADLDWCLSQLKPSDKPLRNGAHYRKVVCVILAEAAGQMNAQQKERAFQAANDLLTRSMHNEEIGMEVVGSITIMGCLEDKRAIPVLRLLLTDKRRRVHEVAAEMLAKMETRAEK